MSSHLLTAQLVLGFCIAVVGALMTRVPAARWSGVVTSLSGLVLVGGAALTRTDGTAVTQEVYNAADALVLQSIWPSELAGTAMVAVLTLTGPLAILLYPRVPRKGLQWSLLPIGVGAGVATVAFGGAVPGAGLGPVAGVGQVIVALVIVAHLWWGLFRSTGHERRALIWLSLGLAGGLALDGTVSSMMRLWSVVVWEEGWRWLGMLVLPPVAMLIGTRRPELIGPRARVLSLASVGTAVLVTVMIYLMLASLLGLTARRETNVVEQAALAVLVGACFRPVLTLSNDLFERLLFGGRQDPPRTPSEVPGSLGTDPADAMAPLQEGLVLPYVAITLEGVEMAAVGTPTAQVRRVPLPRTGGELIIGVRPGDLGSTPSDRKVLHLAVPLIDQTVRAYSLNLGLRKSRALMRSMLEDERRRLRYDLHDGLGPRLTGIAYAADAVGNLLADQPWPERDQAKRLLEALRGEAAEAVAEIRRIVYGMRPTALDGLGLLGAVRQQAAGLRRGDQPLTLTIDAPEPFPTLPASVEVAAYRILAEALTNVVRHSGSTTALIIVRVESGQLRLGVVDAGTDQGPWTAGVGLASMRERALEIGGTFSAGPTSRGGRVEVLLPLADPHPVVGTG